MPEPAPAARRFVTQDRRFAAALRDEALATALGHCIAAGRDETGGVILGRYSASHGCAEIHELGPPPHGSTATRTSFYRGTGGLQELLRRRWAEGLYYLGEWHFHPFAAPTPSAADIRQLELIATDPGYRCPEPLLIVIGADPRKCPRLGMFVCPRGGRLLALVDQQSEATTS